MAAKAAAGSVARVMGRPMTRKSAPASIFALSVLGVAGLGFVVDQILFYLHAAMPSLLDTNALNLLNQTFANASPAAFAGMTLVISIGPGVAEELFFRGVLMILSRFTSSSGLVMTRM